MFGPVNIAGNLLRLRFMPKDIATEHTANMPIGKEDAL